MKMSKTYNFRKLYLLFALIVFAHGQVTPESMSQQSIKPITRDNLISSLKLGRRERKTAARYIELINRYGVDFTLTPKDEREIRRLGVFLGKDGLDKLVAAVRNNYRVDTPRIPPASQSYADPPLSFLRHMPIQAGSTQRLDLLMKAKGYTGPMAMSVLIVANDEQNQDDILVGTEPVLNDSNSERVYPGGWFNFPGGENAIRVYIHSVSAGKVNVTYRPMSVSAFSPPSSPQERPDISLRLVHPKGFAVVFVNESNVILREPKYIPAMWNLDRDRWNEPLPIPVDVGDWIRPRETNGPNSLIGQDRIAPLIKQGDRLFGVIQVTCPECIRTRAYWVYAMHGVSGWYAEVPEGKYPDLNAIFKLLPEIRKNPEQFFSDIPQSRRVTIEDR